MAQAAGMVIVGAGECGFRAAIGLRQHGYEGSITLIGSEKWLPYERPPLSKSILLQSDEPVSPPIVAVEQLQAARINWQPETRVLSLGLASQTVLTDRHEVLHYDKLLLATGASPRALPIDGETDRFLTLRTFEDALMIRKALASHARVAVIGGGFIGLEVAASARQLGCDVVIIEAQERILKRGVPEIIANRIRDLHLANGAKVVCGIGIASLRGDTHGATITLADGQEIQADLVVVGIGAQPNVDIAAAAGLICSNGIDVDANLQSSDRHVFAAGDCCSFPLALYNGRRVRLESWRNAIEQGEQAAHAMLGRHQTDVTIPWFWSDQYDWSLQSVGLADEGTDTVTRELGNGGIILFHLTFAGKLVAASAFGPGNSVAKDIKIIERAILAGVSVTPENLADPEFKLKSLLNS